MKLTIEGENLKVSDGYHTIDELYEHRIALYMALCKQLVPAHYVWKSENHSDGSNYENWFILGIGSAPGNQISYHLPMKFWTQCGFAVILDKAPEFDGHTSQDVLKRIGNLI